MNDARISIQAYTVRDAAQTDLNGTMMRLATMGYRNIELTDIVGRFVDHRIALDISGLRAPSAHARILGKDVAPVFAAARALDVEYVIDPSSGQDRWTSRNSVLRVASELNSAARRAADEGLVVGYHNHAYELEARFDGVPALEIFADELDPAVVLELDTYWVAVGGEDIVQLIRKLGSRVRLLHIKDGPITDENTAQVAIGDGAMPVDEIISAAAPDALLVVELDDFDGDVFDPVQRSISWLHERGIR